MTYWLLGIFASLLPNDWRRRWQWTSGESLALPAAISGIVESVGCLLTFVVRYLAFAQNRVGMYAGAAVRQGTPRAMGAVFGAGGITTLEFLLRPVSILLAYFAFEGVLRAYAAGISREVVGTLPLFVVGFVLERIGLVKKERAMGPRILDEVHFSPRATCPLGITSCRPKEGWDSLITVEYQDEFYEVAEQRKGQAPRPYVYLLRKVPPGKVIRNIHHYSPDEVLPETERRKLQNPLGDKPEDQHGET